MSNVIIKASDLAKSYETGAVTTHALRGVSLEIEKGSFTAIVGPSGHGKSTLMHLLGGLDRPSAGSVFIEGTDLRGLDNSGLARLRGEKIGFVFQFFNLLQGLSAKENIEVAAMLAGVPEKDQGARALALLAQVGLADKAGSKPSQLSGGQQQRVAIARALVNDPALLLMDEPTGNLDSASEAEVLEILRKLHVQGKTVVVVTHNNEIAQKAEQVICVRDGRIAA
ncbi:ABC transporter ATP-binding protein [Geomonas paludis]|uniref:ABC transporter ATP-binding protein n=1 Tax=Geomonas paludis TaxID=2740185 RepID=A0A6V8MTU5_9BACT|nr:ABC transporter ATP-binding protein [Geomonas paludis]UPU37895.1 ABC transporter ATP-binding protein [Geomonas paludis]GFO63586.1 ABC transporter ATP-binding protein [Geomonas paludis]